MNKTLMHCLIPVTLGVMACGAPDPQPARPNVLIVLADDMGYGDPGCYGGLARTPTLDALARNGIRFTDFYAGAPLCSPSRAALLTGRVPSRAGIYNYRSPNHPMHLRKEEVTMASILKEQGYQTAIFGKWHLGALLDDTQPGEPHPTPGQHGFDYYFSTENNAEPMHLNPENFIRNGQKTGMLEGFSCQLVADEAISWMRNTGKQNGPLFMYVAFNEPHASTRQTAPPDLAERFSHLPEHHANHLANIENLDSALGRIIRHLTEQQMLDNTLILFSSDNGSIIQASNGDLRGRKSHLYEGGIRVPGIIHWPASPFMSNRVIHEAAGLVDILPTILDILHVDPLPGLVFDGASIVNLLTGKAFTRENPLYWFFYRNSPEIALRLNNHMIMGKDNDLVPRTHPLAARDMEYIKTMTLKTYELYDLGNDISQTWNIIEDFPGSGTYKQIIGNKLREIQTHGYIWENLPDLEDNPARIKTR